MSIIDNARMTKNMKNLGLYFSKDDESGKCYLYLFDKESEKKLLLSEFKDIKHYERWTIISALIATRSRRRIINDAIATYNKLCKFLTSMNKDFFNEID